MWAAVPRPACAVRTLTLILAKELETVADRQLQIQQVRDFPVHGGACRPAIATANASSNDLSEQPRLRYLHGKEETSYSHIWPL